VSRERRLFKERQAVGEDQPVVPTCIPSKQAEVFGLNPAYSLEASINYKYIFGLDPVYLCFLFFQFDFFYFFIFIFLRFFLNFCKYIFG
jgi:hypothetical protein